MKTPSSLDHCFIAIDDENADEIKIHANVGGYEVYLTLGKLLGLLDHAKLKKDQLKGE